MERVIDDNTGDDWLTCCGRVGTHHLPGVRDLGANLKGSFEIV